jgi:16S rRNA (cytidine1402-2'-O)-methyltransferase
LVANERRTLVVLSGSGQRRDDLFQALGDRPIVVVMASEQGTEIVWRGTLDDLPEQVPGQPPDARLVLVIGGAPRQVVRWEEARLRAEIESGLAQGLGAKEVSRRLAAESGWPRREIYRLVVEMQ